MDDISKARMALKRAKEDGILTEKDIDRIDGILFARYERWSEFNKAKGADE